MRVRKLLGLLKKEFLLHSRFRFSLFKTLFLGPATNGVTAFIIYSGLHFQSNHFKLGSMNDNNFGTALLLGFLVHSYLNGGFYLLSEKFKEEHYHATLGLLWLSPLDRKYLLTSFAAVPFIRCLVLSACIFWLLPRESHGNAWLYLQEAGVFSLLFLFSMTIGFLQGMLAVSFPQKAEISSSLYLPFVFLGCFYFPPEILPSVLKPFCYANPAFHGMRLALALWEGTATNLLPHWIGLAGGTFSLLAAAYLGWRLCAPVLIERSV